MYLIVHAYAITNDSNAQLHLCIIRDEGFIVDAVGSHLSLTCRLHSVATAELTITPRYPDALHIDLYNVPYTVSVCPIYFLSDREDSQAWFSLPHNMAETSVNAFVQVCGRKYVANKSSHIKTNWF